MDSGKRNPGMDKHGIITRIKLLSLGVFFDNRFRRHPVPKDKNMYAESIEEYQSFLKSLGYAPIAEAAFGRKL